MPGLPVRYNRNARKAMIVSLGVGFFILIGMLVVTTSVRAPPQPKTLEEQKLCREQQFDPESHVIQLHSDNFYEKVSIPDTTWFILL
jgi:hypothetical protein